MARGEASAPLSRTVGKQVAERRNAKLKKGMDGGTESRNLGNVKNGMWTTGPVKWTKIVIEANNQETDKDPNVMMESTVLVRMEVLIAAKTTNVICSVMI